MVVVVRMVWYNFMVFLFSRYLWLLFILIHSMLFLCSVLFSLLDLDFSFPPPAAHCSLQNINLFAARRSGSS